MSLIPITDFTLVVFVPTVLILPRAHGITTRINCYSVVDGVVVEGVKRDPTIYAARWKVISRFSSAPIVPFFL